MYYLSDFTFQKLLFTSIQLLAVNVGGYLLLSAYSRLNPKDRIIPGLSLGLVLFIVLANIFARLAAPQTAFPMASGLILLTGVLAAYKKRSEISWRHSLREEGFQLILFFLLLAIFVLVNRGLAIFDDYHNLPLVSIMATGKIPPPFYLKTDTPMAYHYGLHIFATFLVTEGNFFPWSAYDISKALVISLTIMNGWIWLRRKNLGRNSLLSALFIFTLAGGTRWLLLFAPAGWLQKASENLVLFGEQVTSRIWLTESISTAWQIEGGGPFPFPFAYANGIFQPLIFSLGSNATLPLLTILVMLLLRPVKFSAPTVVLYSLCIASLGLSAELYVGLVYVGAALVIPLLIFQKKDRSIWLPWILSLALALPLILVQGGVLSDLFSSLIAQVFRGAAQETGFGSFMVSPSPAVISAHLGPLPLLNINTALIALIEIGPVLLLIPFTVNALKKSWSEMDLLPVIVLLGSYALSLLSLFIHYSVVRDTSRIIGNSCFLWLLFGLPVLLGSETTKQHIRTAVLAAVSSATLSGIVLMSVMLTSVKSPVQSYFVTGPDAQLSNLYWNTLEEDAWIFDPQPHRAVTLFGRISDSRSNLFTFLDSYEALLRDPHPITVSRAGFDYYYLDDVAWQFMTTDQRSAFEDECVQSMKAIEDNLGNLRILYDISACR